MERFLKARHWHMFVLLFGIPILLMIVMMIVVIGPIAAHPETPPKDFFPAMMVFYCVIMVIGVGGMFAWQWSVGVGLQRKIPADIPMKVRLFKGFLLTPLIYIFFFIFFVFYMLSTAGQHNGEPPMALFIIMPLLVPLHLFSMFCIVYNLVFVAKTIKTAELQRPVTFSEFGLEFVLVWFLPIGIWLLQPRINKLMRELPDATA